MGGGVEGLCPSGVGVAWEEWAWLGRGDGREWAWPCVRRAWPERGGRGLGGVGVAWV